MTRILISDNGPHPPEKWAIATAEMIVDIDPKMDGPRLIQAQKLQLAVAEALVPHHILIQYDERNNLSADPNYISGSHNVEDYLSKSLDDVVATAKGSLWETHFANADVQAEIKGILANHFRSSQHIERLWHADRSPSSKAAQQYKARFHG